MRNLIRVDHQRSDALLTIGIAVLDVESGDLVLELRLEGHWRLHIHLLGRLRLRVLRGSLGDDLVEDAGDIGGAHLDLGLGGELLRLLHRLRRVADGLLLLLEKSLERGAVEKRGVRLGVDLVDLLDQLLDRLRLLGGVALGLLRRRGRLLGVELLLRLRLLGLEGEERLRLLGVELLLRRRRLGRELLGLERLLGGELLRLERLLGGELLLRRRRLGHELLGLERLLGGELLRLERLLGGELLLRLRLLGGELLDRLRLLGGELLRLLRRLHLVGDLRLALDDLRALHADRLIDLRVVNEVDRRDRVEVELLAESLDNIRELVLAAALVSCVDGRHLESLGLSLGLSFWDFLGFCCFLC